MDHGLWTMDKKLPHKPQGYHGLWTMDYEQKTTMDNNSE